MNIAGGAAKLVVSGVQSRQASGIYDQWRGGGGLSMVLGKIAALVAALFAVSAAAQDRMGVAASIPVATDAPLPPASADRSIRIGGKTLSYRASWFETVLKDERGTAQATISATSYVRAEKSDVARRPVIVLFNGGPGASSSPLHFSAFGPRRLGERDAAGNRSLIDNSGTLLDTADLVFVDPVGTGFSRPITPTGGKNYWGVDGDAAAVSMLIHEWLKANGRLASPLFIAGESYGGYRAGALAKSIGDLNLAGLILISPALDFGGGTDQSAIDRLPTMAIAAWHHGKVEKDDRTVEQVWDDARRFAQTDYAVALQQGSALDPATRTRIAARVAALIGLPVEQVVSADLRVDTQSFLEALVPGKIVGRLDVRVSAPKPDKPANPDRPAAANDPALGLGRTNVIVSKPIGDYLRGEIGVKTSRDYYSLTLDVNFNWDWRSPEPGPGSDWSVAPSLAKLMAAKPKLKLLLVGGYYDLTVPVMGPRYTLSHSKVPLDRVQMLALPAGHSPFEGDANLAIGSKAVHEFIERAFPQ